MQLGLARRRLVAAAGANAFASCRSRAAAVAAAALAARGQPLDGHCRRRLYDSHGHHCQQHSRLVSTTAAAASAPPGSPRLLPRLMMRGCGPVRGLSSTGPSREKEEDRPPQHPDTQQQQQQQQQHKHARETVWTTPNLITMSRIAASPLLSWAILGGHYEYAVAGVAVAAATDWLDGYIAKTYDQTSVLGGFLDPLADKVLVAALSVPLAIQGHIPMPLLVVIFGRDALLIAGSFAKRAMQRPEGSPFFDTTSTATFQITPSLLSKSNTVLQFTVLLLALSRALWGVPGPEAFEPLCWLTGATTVASGLSYLVGGGTAMLKRPKIWGKGKGKGAPSDQQPPPAPPSA